MTRRGVIDNIGTRGRQHALSSFCVTSKSAHPLVTLPVSSLSRGRRVSLKNVAAWLAETASTACLVRVVYVKIIQDTYLIPTVLHQTTFFGGVMCTASYSRDTTRSSCTQNLSECQHNCLTITQLKNVIDPSAVKKVRRLETP